MKSTIVFISCVLAIIAAQNPSSPIPNYPVGSMRRALYDGTIADICHNFTGFPENLLYENQNCKYPEDDDVSKEFKLCYLSFFFNKTSQEPECLDMDLIKFLINTPDELKLIYLCAEEYLDKCCVADWKNRAENCYEFMNCYTYCALDCKDLCPVNFTLNENKKRSRV